LIKTRNQFLQELEHRDQSKETKERIFVTKWYTDIILHHLWNKYYS
jgi:hypothetical protein